VQEAARARDVEFRLIGSPDPRRSQAAIDIATASGIHQRVVVRVARFNERVRHKKRGEL
jgi:hypothetical protein